MQAAISNSNRWKYERDVLNTAVVCFWGVRAWVSSILSRLLLEVSRGVVRLVACFTYVQYDETPMWMRTPGMNSSWLHASKGNVEKYLLPGMRLDVDKTKNVQDCAN